MKCTHTNKNGKTCNSKAMRDSEFCYYHNPNVTDEAKRISRRKGGLTNKPKSIHLEPLPLKTSDDVLVLLADTINKVRSGDMDIRIANTLGYLSMQLLKAMDNITIEKRISLLEDKLVNKEPQEYKVVIKDYLAD